MSPESLLDGFAQRFAYVVSSDPETEKPRDARTSDYMEIDKSHLEVVAAVAWSK